NHLAAFNTFSRVSSYSCPAYVSASLRFSSMGSRKADWSFLSNSARVFPCELTPEISCSQPIHQPSALRITAVKVCNFVAASRIGSISPLKVRGASPPTLRPDRHENRHLFPECKTRRAKVETPQNP